MSRTETHLRAVLDAWEDKIDRLLAAPQCQTVAGHETYGQYLRELVDRRDTLRNKWQRVQQVSEARSEEAQRGFAAALDELQKAWDAVLTKIAWTEQ